MTETLDNLRCRFINNVLLAASQEAVSHYSDQLLLDLQSYPLPDDGIARFLSSVLIDLDSFDPISRDARQWNNISAAKIFCRRIHQRYLLSHV